MINKQKIIEEVLKEIDKDLWEEVEKHKGIFKNNVTFMKPSESPLFNKVVDLTISETEKHLEKEFYSEKNISFQRLLEWIRTPHEDRKSADIEFTSGIFRDIARLFEKEHFLSKEHALRNEDKDIEAWQQEYDRGFEEGKQATAKEIFDEIEISFKGEIWRNSYLNPQNKLQQLKKKFLGEEK